MNNKKNNKVKLRLFETFAGIGSQHKALENLEKSEELKDTFETELVGIAEWDINSMTVYHRIHYPKTIKMERQIIIQNFIDKTIKKISELKKQNKTKDNLSEDDKKEIIKTVWKLPQFKQEILDALEKEFLNKGFVLSSDTKNPIKSYSKLKVEKLLDIYHSLIKLNNFSSVMILKDKVKEIKNIDIFTYSFPCQAISLQGKQEGLTENSGTSSSLLWSIRDFLQETFLQQQKQEINHFNEKIKLPNYLLMENVSALYNPKNKVEWNKFKQFLEEIGYNTEEIVLKASHFGIPQNRDRAFALSVLKNNQQKDKILSDFKNLENIKKPLKMINDFLVIKSKEEAEKLNLLIDEKYQIQKEKFKESKTTKNLITKIVLTDYTTFQSENMVYHSKKSVSPTITAQGAQSRIKIYDEDLDCIRYMTAEEHLKLMGFGEKDYQSIIKSCKQSQDLNINDKNIKEIQDMFINGCDVSEVLIKKMAGNSIVVNVLEEIFKTIIKNH